MLPRKGDYTSWSLMELKKPFPNGEMKKANSKSPQHCKMKGTSVRIGQTRSILLNDRAARSKDRLAA